MQCSAVQCSVSSCIAVYLIVLGWFKMKERVIVGYVLATSKFKSARLEDLCKSDIRLARTQTSPVSEHAHNTGHSPLWNKVKFIDGDPHWYTGRVKETIHISIHPNNINRDSEIEIPKAWIPTMKN